MKFLILLSALVSTVAMALPLDPQKGNTEFLAVGRPAAIKIAGKAPGPAGDFQFTKSEKGFRLNGQAKLSLESLDTGISLRDRHMKEKYLETQKYNEAVLTLKDVEVPRAVIEKGGDLTVPAKLQLHGVEKPVGLSLKISVQDGKLKSDGTFKVKLSDYSIAIPQFSGITVADDVEIKTVTEFAQGEVLRGSL